MTSHYSKINYFKVGKNNLDSPPQIWLPRFQFNWVFWGKFQNGVGKRVTTSCEFKKNQ